MNDSELLKANKETALKIRDELLSLCLKGSEKTCNEIANEFFLLVAKELLKPTDCKTCSHRIYVETKGKDLKTGKPFKGFFKCETKGYRFTCEGDICPNFELIPTSEELAAKIQLEIEKESDEK